MNFVKLEIRVVFLKILMIMLLDKANAQTTGKATALRVLLFSEILTFR